ncbi:MAG: c-type cytochrome [bacterium]
MIKYTFIFIFGLFSLPVKAESVAEMVAQLEQKTQNPESLQQAVKAGHERMVLCGYCHGKDGNAVKPKVPNLAGQNPAYLFTQFEHFKTGVRKDYVMSQLAKDMTDQDKINVAIYFSRQQVKSTPSNDGAAIVKGQKKFQSICFACHGKEAMGKKNIPRLAGQPEEYLSYSLTRFKQQDAKRGKTVMSGIAQELTEDEIKNVAAYLSSL